MSIRTQWPLTQRRILLAAAERGCTQDAIASHLSTPDRPVSRPTVARWMSLADPLKMTLDQLLGVVELAGDIAILNPLLEACGREASPAKRSTADVIVDLFASAGELVAERRAAEADGSIDERERARLAATAGRTVELARELGTVA